MPDIYVANKPKKNSLKKQITEPLADHKPTQNPLAAFVAKPLKIRFETQEKKEKIVLLLRRHPITNFSWAAKTGLMLVLPQILGLVFPLEFLPPRFCFFTLVGWYLLTFAFAFERFLSWLFNVNIITDERVIDIDFPTILYRDVSEAKIDKIEDISIKTGGYVPSFFNYGDVLVQTAGAVPEIHFEAVPRPERVTQVLNDLIYQEEVEKMEGRIR